MFHRAEIEYANYPHFVPSAKTFEYFSRFGEIWPQTRKIRPWENSHYFPKFILEKFMTLAAGNKKIFIELFSFGKLLKRWLRSRNDAALKLPPRNRTYGLLKTKRNWLRSSNKYGRWKLRIPPPICCLPAGHHRVHVWARGAGGDETQGARHHKNISEGDQGAGEGVSMLPLTEEVIQAVDKSDFQVDQFRRQMNCEYTS